MDGFDDASFAAIPEPTATVSKIDEFNASWEAKLTTKASEEESTKDEMHSTAQASLEAMKLERDELRERNSSRNREHEQALCEQIDADIEGSGNSWERVGKLVDLTQIVTDSVDCTRMRQVIIKKKNTA